MAPRMVHLLSMGVMSWKQLLSGSAKVAIIPLGSSAGILLKNLLVEIREVFRILGKNQD